MKNILFIVTFFILASCGSDDEFVKHDAIIIDSGDPAQDGCGWLVRINSEDYKPVNLPEKFEVDDLAVIVTYNVLKEKGDCDIPNSIRQIDIKKIVEKH